MKGQIKSKQRVADFGEVYTAEREIKAMCDLVKQETERIESRFLEPACGQGPFLQEVLKRKLQIVKERYAKSPSDYEKYSVIAICSIYGVDLLPDNAEECRQLLYSIWNDEYTNNMKKNANDECREAVKYILKKNILCGDALTLLQSDGKPIIFAEWSMVTGNMIKRRDFALADMLNGHEAQMDLFNAEGGGATLEYDEETKGFIPGPLKEYPLTDYRRVNQYE